MKLLLDTHTLLWWVLRDRRLRASTLALLAEGDTAIVVSVVSGWEIATKFRLGKLAVPDSLAKSLGEVVKRNGWQDLPLTMAHAQLAGNLKGDHKDPFDRMLAAQAIIEHMPLVTDDPAFAVFEVETVW